MLKGLDPDQDSSGMPLALFQNLKHKKGIEF